MGYVLGRKDFGYKVKMGKVKMKVKVGDELNPILGRYDGMRGVVIDIDKNGLLIDFGHHYGNKFYHKDKLQELEF